MYLTCDLKLRANNHDRALLRRALSRWHQAFSTAMERAQARDGELLHCLAMWRSKDGQRQKLVTDSKRLHGLTLECCRGIATHLHSSASMSLIVAVEEQLSSYLGQYTRWVAEGRKAGLKPRFPTVPPGSNRLALARWEQALSASNSLMTEGAEAIWRSEVTRAQRGRHLPMYFGAATSGGETGQAHCGLLRRADGRYFALLTLWGQGDPAGESVQRAGNRAARGEVRNLRAAVPFAPTDRARASIMLPVERGSGPGARTKRWERLFMERGTPKSAELIEKEGEFYLHVAFDYAPPSPRPLTGAVLAVRRGIGTLLVAVVLDSGGRTLAETAIDGKDLRRTIHAILQQRQVRQEKGRSTKGDRRAAAVAEHTIKSAARQIADLACQHGAEIVLLDAPGRARPTPLLAYRHFTRLAESLASQAAFCGLPEPRVRPIYGSRRTCPACGCVPEIKGKENEPQAANKLSLACPGCGRTARPETDAARLLALDTLRLRLRGDMPKLAEYIRQLSLNEP